MTSLLQALRNARPVLRISKLADEVKAHVQIEGNVVSEMVRVLVNIARAYSSVQPMERKTFAKALLESIGEEPTTDEDATLSFLDERLATVLAVPSVEISGKARSVIQDHANVFCAARVFTDLRPVFTEHELRPQAGVIVHQLKLSYHTGADGDIEQFFLTIDAEDLRSLRDSLDRATRKEQQLEQAIGTSGMMVLSNASS